jgi:Putative collagen-binding domain of a collagenase/Fibronectin type III domain
VMVYMPTRRTITVDMTKLGGSTTAQWYDPANGTYVQIAGSPFSNTGTRNFTPPGNNADGDGDWVLVLEATVDPLRIVTTSLPQATAGTDYSSQIVAAGGSQPYSWSLSSDSPPLPLGMTFSAVGLLSGVSTVGGMFEFIVQVVDSTNALTTQDLTLRIVVPDESSPTIPTGLTATPAGIGQLNLSWTPSSDDVGVTGYLVERSQGAGSGAFTQVGTPASTTFNDTGLAANTVYNYRVRATDASGNLSGYSSVASATTPSAPAGGVSPPGVYSVATGTALSGNIISTTTDAGSGANRLQLIFVSWWKSTGTSISKITNNAGDVAFRVGGTSFNATDTTRNRCDLWCIVNPAAGTTSTKVVFASSIEEMTVSVVSLTNASQLSTPFTSTNIVAATSGSGTSRSASYGTTPTDLVIDAAFMPSAVVTLTPSSPQSALFSTLYPAVGTQEQVASQRGGASGSVDNTWTSTSMNFAMLGVSVKAASK